MKKIETYKYAEIEDHFYDYIEEQDKEWIEDNKEELHHHTFNTDYFIIGTYKAKQWLGDKAFDVISIVKDYERDTFGEAHTDLSNPEKVVNMYAYIVGEDIVRDYLEEREEVWLDY